MGLPETNARSLRIAPVYQVNLKAADLASAKDHLYNNGWTPNVASRVTAVASRGQFLFLGFENGDLVIMDVTSKAEERHPAFHNSVG